MPPVPGPRPPEAAASHHEVLPAWAALRRRTDRPAAIVVLDHHADVLPAFGRRDPAEAAERIAAFDWRDDATVRGALPFLRHDEHLDLALRSGIADRIWVVAQENFTLPAHPGMTVKVAPGWPDGPTMLNDPVRCRPWADRVLESDFLETVLPPPEWFAGRRYILDIDLDYFMTARGATPADPVRFRALAAGSALLTVSLERDWVRLLRLAGETIDSDRLLSLLNRTLNG